MAVAQILAHDLEKLPISDCVPHLIGETGKPSLFGSKPLGQELNNILPPAPQAALLNHRHAHVPRGHKLGAFEHCPAARVWLVYLQQVGAQGSGGEHLHGLHYLSHQAGG